ncbi:MAG: hypothetical protein H7Y38_05450 [Armatimonadetes bacterium]|nr:hypothetical protein [Armatimonadota bacterium]
MNPEAQYLWHTTPLFYLPHLLQTGAIYSAREIAARGLPVRPRPSAIRRKTRLGLADFVHLSPQAVTPLLRDKLEKGYAHVLIAFRRADVLRLPGACLLRYNTKRWAHRDDFLPVTDAEEMATVWAEHDAGRFPSLEILVPGSLSLSLADAVHVRADDEGRLLQALVSALALPVPTVCLSLELFSPCDAPANLEAVREYFAGCESAARVLDPPALPFD